MIGFIRRHAVEVIIAITLLGCMAFIQVDTQMKIRQVGERSPAHAVAARVLGDCVKDNTDWPTHHAVSHIREPDRDCRGEIAEALRQANQAPAQTAVLADFAPWL